MAADSDEVQRLLAYIDKKLAGQIQPFPGGWPRETEIALIDAVFSARASYGRPAEDGRPASGVHRVIAEYRELRGSGGKANDLTALIAAMNKHTIRPFHAISRQRVPGRASDRPTKWQAVRSVANDLVALDVAKAADVKRMRKKTETTQALKAAFTNTSGVGAVTFNYFLLLLGEPRVKADVMIRSFVAQALGLRAAKGIRAEMRVTPERAAALVMEAANQLQVSPPDLDHTIWTYERQARKRRR